MSAVQHSVVSLPPGVCTNVFPAVQTPALLAHLSTAKLDTLLPAAVHLNFSGFALNLEVVEFEILKSVLEGNCRRCQHFGLARAPVTSADHLALLIAAHKYFEGQSTM